MEAGSGTLLDAVPNATLSTSSPGCAVWLEIFRRPSGPASDKTPKNVPPSGARIVKLPKSTLAGLNTERSTLPTSGPANTSSPAAFADVNVRFKLSAKAFGPRTLLVFPADGNPAPSNTMLDPGEAV